MNIFLISPVRKVRAEEAVEIEMYVSKLEADGRSVHWPARDTQQNDPTGVDICLNNCAAIAAADEVHVWWNPLSKGSLFDLGMAFAHHKPIKIANPAYIEGAREADALMRNFKSFEAVMLDWPWPIDITKRDYPHNWNGKL